MDFSPEKNATLFLSDHVFVEMFFSSINTTIIRLQLFFPINS